VLLVAALAVWAGSPINTLPVGIIPALTLIGCVYLVLALRYWFRTPAIGIAIGTGCFAFWPETTLREEANMRRECALKFVLVLVGLLFCAGVYRLILMVKQEPALALMMSLYATLGTFLLLASRNPSTHRSLIAFTAWSSFAHASVMAVQAFLSFIARRELLGVATSVVIGVALIALAPAKQSVERVSAAVA
jgi:hypothetical protein